MKFNDVAFADAIKWLRIASGRNILVKRRALKKEGIDPADVRVSLQLEAVSVATVLRVIAEGAGMAVQVKGNIIYFTTERESYGRVLTRIYSIAHITWRRVDFPSPPLDLRPSNYTPVEEYEPEVIDEDDPLADGESVIELLKQFVTPKGWETYDHWSISGTKRYIVVKAPASVHRKIPKALSDIAAMK